jgi:hypothetical protein
MSLLEVVLSRVAADRHEGNLSSDIKPFLARVVTGLTLERGHRPVPPASAVQYRTVSLCTKINGRSSRKCNESQCIVVHAFQVENELWSQVQRCM